eukprot:14836452-Ditylum_brightwellii.AAC.1
MAPGLSKMETVIFFSNMALMDVNAKALAEQGKEGIVEAEDLAEFDEATWKQVADNLLRPGNQMKNADKGAEKRDSPGDLIHAWDKDTKETS